jgi:hypothetical protein
MVSSLADEEATFSSWRAHVVTWQLANKRANFDRHHEVNDVFSVYFGCDLFSAPVRKSPCTSRLACAVVWKPEFNITH